MTTGGDFPGDWKRKPDYVHPMVTGRFWAGMAAWCVVVFLAVLAYNKYGPPSWPTPVCWHGMLVGTDTDCDRTFTANGQYVR